MDVVQNIIQDLFGDDNSPKEGPMECAKSALIEFIWLYLPQLIASLIYDSIIDLCDMESLSFIATFIIGVTYVSTYDYEKFKVLLSFIALSILLILPCKLCDKALRLTNASIALYTVAIVGLAIYLNGWDATFYNMEKPENRMILSLAYMNFLAYTVHEVNDPLHSGLSSYFSWHFLGYMFNPVNVIHGPWLTVDMYNRLYIYKQTQIYSHSAAWNNERFFGFMQFTCNSFCFYALGKCVVPMLIHNLEESDKVHLWALVYLKCLRYRLMHYAQCHLSSASLICAGQHYYFGFWHFPVTMAWNIEFPVSLATAVASYDRQLTSFVHKYFTHRFDYLQPMYSRCDLITLPLIYILTSYDRLSFLAAILTLYIFVLAQNNCQLAVANGLSICVNRFPCIERYCVHRFKQTSPLSVACKLIFVTLNVITITYVQIALMEADYKRIWKELKYVGHVIFIAYLLLGMIIIDFYPAIVRSDDDRRASLQSSRSQSQMVERRGEYVDAAISFVNSEDLIKAKIQGKQQSKKKKRKRYSKPCVSVSRSSLISE